jgi:hypothetical protein
MSFVVGGHESRIWELSRLRAELAEAASGAWEK